MLYWNAFTLLDFYIGNICFFVNVKKWYHICKLLKMWMYKVFSAEIVHILFCISGTYNSQYMVVDLNRISLGHSMENGALTVVEQIPGKVMHSDQTPALRRGRKRVAYLSIFCLSSFLSHFIAPWAGQLPPLVCYIWQVIGHPTTYPSMLTSTTWVGIMLCGRDMEKTFPTTCAPVLKSSAGTRPRCMTSTPSNTSWDTTVGPTITLAWLFSDCKQRDLSQPDSVSDYKRDPYSKGHPCKTICCRNDLRPRRPRPGGCYDSKVRGHD